MKRFLWVFLAVTLLEILFYFSPHKYLPDPEGEILQTQDIDTLDIKFDGHIYVKANIHEDTIGYWFMFDTGASGSVIDEELVRKYGLDYMDEMNLLDANNSNGKTSIVNISDFRVGSTVFSNHHFLEDTRYKSKCYGKKDYGIIGANMMRKCNWYIDFQAKKMYLAKKSVPFETNYDAFTIPFIYSYQNAVPRIHLKANDMYVSDVVFDLGSNGFLSLPMDLYTENTGSFSNNEQLTSKGEHNVGMFGSVNENHRSVHLDSLTIGDLVLKKQFVDFETQTLKLLGNGVLSFYNLFINYRTNEIKLIPVRGENFTLSRSRRGYGFLLKLEDNNDITISKVHGNSPAEMAGLEYGDKILKINGEAFHGDECDFNRWAGQKLGGQTVTLDIFNKGTINLNYAKDF